MLITTPNTIPGSLRILRAMAELTKAEAREAANQPQVVTDALDDTIDALTSALDVIARHPAPLPRLRVTPLRLTRCAVTHSGPECSTPHPPVSIDTTGTGYLDQHDRDLDAWRAVGDARRTETAVTACACDLWPLTDLDATQDDGVTVHAYTACVTGGKIIAERTGTAQAQATAQVTGGDQ